MAADFAAHGGAMASAREKRLARVVESGKAGMARLRQTKKRDKETMGMGAGVVLGGIAAAGIDARYNDPDNDAEVARIEKLADLPTNGVVGAALAIGSCIGNRRKASVLRHTALGTGLGMFTCALYQGTRSKFEEWGDDD